MAQIFPPWTNKLPVVLLLVVAVVGIGGVCFFWYFGSPEYTDVGYRPDQPVEFSHRLHAGDLGMDCRYCHSQVEFSAHANIPPTQTCMNCHKIVATDSEKLLPVRESWAEDDPIDWVRVHETPDYAYFNHSAHINAGVGCATCHGNVRAMPKITQSEPLNMAWCLECHRSPDKNLRPASEITNMEWTPSADHERFVEQLKAEKNISPPTDCAACHR